MIISRTPVRLSFFGGGSDYPQFYLEHGGAVLATSINHYCYVMLHNGKMECTFDLPGRSGLGSSSAFTVGLLRACNVGMKKPMIAEVATILEREKLDGNIGSQDQYLCAMGGFHHLRFNAHGIRDTLLAPELVAPLHDYLLLFDTHQYRRAGEVVSHQLAQMGQNLEHLKQMAKMADDGLELVQKQDWQMFGKLLEEAWYKKKQLSDRISTLDIDAIYDKAILAGASSGKLLGAGGGGFILFFVEPDKQAAVKTALSTLTWVPFQLESEGTEVIFSDRP